MDFFGDRIIYGGFGDVVHQLWTRVIDFYLWGTFNLLKPTGYVMHPQVYIQELYILPTLYLCVLYLCENKQRLVPLTA